MRVRYLSLSLRNTGTIPLTLEPRPVWLVACLINVSLEVHSGPLEPKSNSQVNTRTDTNHEPTQSIRTNAPPINVTLELHRELFAMVRCAGKNALSFRHKG